MTHCTASTTAHLCPRRHTCELHRKYLADRSGLPVAIVWMPVSAVGGECYMYRPVEVKTV